MPPSTPTGVLPSAPRENRGLAYGLALIAGLLLAWAVFPAAFVWPTAMALQEGDVAQHAIGQRYFLAEPWGWPLLLARGIVAPFGVSIAFLDSIPLEALVLKAVAAWLPSGFHGIGLWYALAWILQPVAAVFCIRGAGEKRLLPVLTFAVLACAMPAWWNRYGHAALTGHFLLLLALGTYLRLCQAGQAGGLPWRGWLGAMVLLVASLLVHPYLMVMVAATLAAVPATLLVRRLAGLDGRGWGAAALGLVACVVVLGGAASLLRYGGGATPENAYGRYAMNLLSPFWPAQAGLLPPGWRPEMVDATRNGGWEGYNWLGFGVVAALLAGLVAGPVAAWRGLVRHAGLVAALLVLVLLTLTFQVGFGSRVVLDLGTPPDFFGQFRASGRFFWPVAYAMALAGVLMLARLSIPVLRNGLLLLICLLQWIDAGPLRGHVMWQVARQHPPQGVELAALRERLDGVSQVVLLPRWLCTYHRPGGEPRMQELLPQLVGVASERAVPVNDMYLARWPWPVDCTVDARTVATPLRPGELRVLLRPELMVAEVPGGEALCQTVGTVAFCRGGDGGLLAHQTRFEMLAGRPETTLLREGWGEPEGWATWSVANMASLALPQTPAGAERLRLRIAVQGYAPKAGVQPVTVLADGKPVARWRLPHNQGMQQMLDLPAGASLLTFLIEAPTAPRDVGQGNDARRLGVALVRLEVLP